MKSGKRRFFEYAYPVIGYCNKLKVSADELLDFEKMLKCGGCPPIDRMEELFPDAIKHLKSWSFEDVGDYWLGEHNKIVSDNVLCRVYGGEVKHILSPKNGEICRARIEDMTIPLRSYICLEEGDLVSMHHFQVAEKLSRKDFNKYFRQ